MKRLQVIKLALVYVTFWARESLGAISIQAPGTAPSAGLTRLPQDLAVVQSSGCIDEFESMESELNASFRSAMLLCTPKSAYLLSVDKFMKCMTGLQYPLLPAGYENLRWYNDTRLCAMNQSTLATTSSAPTSQQPPHDKPTIATAKTTTTSDTVTTLGNMPLKSAMSEMSPSHETYGCYQVGAYTNEAAQNQMAVKFCQENAQKKIHSGNDTITTLFKEENHSYLFSIGWNSLCLGQDAEIIEDPTRNCTAIMISNYKDCK